MSLTQKRLKISLAFSAFMFFSVTLYSAENKTQTNDTVQLESMMISLYEAQAREVIGRHVPANEFQVDIKIKLNGQSIQDLPYVPSYLSVGAFREANFRTLGQMVQDISIDVFLTERFKGATQKTIQDLLVRKLALEGKSQAATKFHVLSVDVSKPDESFSKDLQKMQTDLKQAQSDFKVLERERNDIRNELALAKSNLENKLRDMEMERLKEKQVRENEVTIPPPETMLAKYGIWWALAFLGFVTLIVSSKMFSSAVKSVGKGISTIAGAIESLGGAFGKKEGGSSESEVHTTNAAQDPNQPPPVASPSAISSLEMLQNRVLALSKDLMENYTERTEGIILKHLIECVSRPETVAKGVAVLELFGKTQSQRIYERLGKRGQEAVLTFLDRGHYGKPKIELMLEAGEELKTKLLSEQFGNLRGTLTIKLANLIVQMTEADQVEVVHELKAELKPRFFVYLESEKLGALISATQTKYPDDVDVILSLIPKIVEVEHKTNLDDQIASIVDQYLKKYDQDAQRPYLPYFQQVIESLNTNLAEKALETLSAADSRIDAFLSSKLVTFKTYFRLPLEVRKDILSSDFSNKSIAALLFGTAQDKRADILDCIEKRRHSLIQEELDGFEGMTQREAMDEHEKAKVLIVDKLKKLLASGELEAHLKTATVVPIRKAA